MTAIISLNNISKNKFLGFIPVKLKNTLSATKYSDK